MSIHRLFVSCVALWCSLTSKRISRRTLITPLPNSSPDLPVSKEVCPVLGTFPDPPGLPEPKHSLISHEHVMYEGCLEAWRGNSRSDYARARQTLSQREHGIRGARGYWGNLDCTYRGDFYVIVLEDTGPKLKTVIPDRGASEFLHFHLETRCHQPCFVSCRETMVNYAQGLHKSGLGFPVAVSHFTCTGTAEGDVRIFDLRDFFENHCDPETCEELRKLLRLLNNVVPLPP